jgi:hypothetical protein
MTSNASLKLNNVLPPVETYGGVGNPYETSLKHRMDSVNTQNELNKTHGGSLRRPIRERTRKRVHWGGSTIRPAEITVPQAPTFGMPEHGPNNGNTLSTSASKTLLAGVSNSQYDSDVKVPPLPSQSGGSLLQRLERLIPKKHSKKNISKKKHSKKNISKKKHSNRKKHNTRKKTQKKK